MNNFNGLLSDFERIVVEYIAFNDGFINTRIKARQMLDGEPAQQPQAAEPKGMTEAIEALQCPETHSYSNPELFERGWEIGRSAALDIVRALLAAYNAGAQGEPYGWIGFDNANGLNAAFYFGPAKPESCTYYFPLYAEPKPTPQTDAARDVLLRAKRMLEGYADSYKRMGQDSTSRGGDGRITCTAVMYDIRDNMVGWIDAEIERIDRAKGE